jgi:hypothetical protein
MMHAQELHRGRGRPHKPSVVASMASALMVYQIDLNDLGVVHKVLWRAGFRYQDAMDHADDAVAAARRLRQS